MKKYIYMLALALMTASCVYPYDVIPDKSVDNIVIEGDILLGEKSYFVVSRVQALDEPYDKKAYLPNADVVVESDRGYVKHALELYEDEPEYEVDLTDVQYVPGETPASYRLRVTLFRGKEYVSEWMQPDGDVVMDNVSYKVSDDKQTLSLMMSLHSTGASQHFRYSYTEDWEYHSYNRADDYYELPSEDYPNGRVLNYYRMGLPGLYYCWNHNVSRGINLATTEDMSDNVLDNYVFKTFKPNDIKLSSLYRVDLLVYPVSSGSYKYYENLKSISSYTGSLFSPMPSAMKGNITCASDPDDFAYGYIAVVFPKRARLYVDNGDSRFYQMEPVLDFESEAVAEEDFLDRYMHGWLPFQTDFIEGSIWGRPARCLDCRLMGGTKNKPADWPTTHE